MECDKVREKLSDYLDGIVSPEEGALIREHMASCPKCEAAYSDLRKTVEHVKNLDEVEPPQWLTQKVMAKVREEAGAEKGIWRKLFYPLRLKLPLEAAATVLIAVTAFYIFKTAEREVKVVQNRPGEVSEQPLSKEARVPQPKEGPGSFKEEKTRPSLGGRIGEIRPSVRPEGRSAEAPPKPDREEGVKAVPNAAEPSSSQNSPPAPAVRPPQAEKGKTPPGVPPAGEGKPGARGKREEEPPAPYAFSQAKQEEAKSGSAAAPSTTQSEKMAIRSDLISGKGVSLTLDAYDTETAEGEIKKVIAKLGGSITGTEVLRDRTVFTARMDSLKISDLFEKLKTIGKLREKKPPSVASGTAEIRIEIIKPSE